MAPEPLPRLDRPARRAPRWLPRAGSAFLVSIAAHAFAAVTIGTVLHAAAAGPPQPPATVEVDVAPPLDVGAETPAPAPEPLRRLAAPHVAQAKVRSVAPRHEAPALAPLDDEAPARFVMRAGTVAPQTTAASTPPSPSSSGVGGARESDIVSEGEVSAPARLVSSGTLVYPPAARRAEVEIDLPMEIVVDTDGRVASARALKRAGYGLDEAALRAIRGYRFSPALRAGLPVRVRMRWTIQFRLG